jgi:hypothetical protein
VAVFINLRVLNPEHEHWRRGIEAPSSVHEFGGNLAPLTRGGLRSRRRTAAVAA